jgi:copper chaperone
MVLRTLIWINNMTEFQVNGMTCGHCVRAVTEAVKAADPKAVVEVDLAAGRVKVESTAPRETLAAAIVGAGYEAT